MTRYDRGTLVQQTGGAAPPRMRAMPQHDQSRKEEDTEMIDMNIKQFLATARAYLLGLIPPQQPALATIPLRRSR